MLGWTCEGERIPSKTCIFLVAPHTSIWDFAYGFFFYRSKGGHLKVMIKQESFFFPVKYLLRSMGGFPIDRTNPHTTLKSVIDAMNACENSSNPNDSFHLTICPEGTRKPVARWKTGYHTIARATGAPVYLAYLDYKKKKIGILPDPIELTDDARADTDRIQKIYEDMHLTALYPEGYITH